LVKAFRVEGRADFVGIDPDAPGAGAPLTFVGVVPDDVVAARVKVHGIDYDALVQSNGFFYELSDAADTCAPVDSVTIFYQDGSSDTIPDEMIGWMSDRPETNAQPAGHDVDGVDAEPLPPPADPNPPPRC
jgi:hypothetical protein